MTRLISWIGNVLRAPETEPDVHFHAGPESKAVVCHDTHCGSPHLDPADA
jgi:hypothetical protein